MGSVLWLGVACAGPAILEAPKPVPGGVLFLWAPPEGTRSVAVAGTFNHWSVTAHPMVPDGKKAGGVWRVVVPLPPGEHAFMFVVNGKDWVTPPLAEDFVEDGFGQRNGIVVVR